MGIGDLVNKAKEALSSEQGEQVSDRVIQGAGDGFDRLSGGRFADRTDAVQEHADRLVGQDGADPAARPHAEGGAAAPQDDAPRH
jgi:hypothetical protein